MADQSFIGKGTIYVKLYDATNAWRPIGNVSKLELSIGQEKKDLLDYTNPGGGKYNSLTRITEVTANMTMHDLDGENIAMAVYGSNTLTSSTAQVTGESHSSVKVSTTWGGFIPTVRLINTSNTSVTVTVGATTHTVTTDYVVKPTGIFITPASAITNGSTVVLTYYPVAENVIEALVNSGYEWALHFDGLNEARSSKPASVDLFRVKFTPAQGLSFIGDDFAAMEVSAEVLSDSTQSTGSKYFDIQVGI